MKRFVLPACILLMFAAGCAHAPFQDTALVELGAEDPRALAERFQARIPERYQLLTTVVFEYKSRKFSGIGTVHINRAGGVFKVAGMNPMGVKLFEVSGDRNSAAPHYVIADFTKYGDIAAAVGSDIRRIYLDLLPGPEAKSRKEKYKLFFKQPSGPGFMEYVFAGAEGDLIEKNYYEEDGVVWKISYYEYRDQDGRRWPRGIVLNHYQYGYRLIVRQKELLVENN